MASPELALQKAVVAFLVVEIVFFVCDIELERRVIGDAKQRAAFRARQLVPDVDDLAARVGDALAELAKAEGGVTCISVMIAR